MAKKRLPLSVMAALGLTAPGCEPEPPMMPCLSIAYDDRDDRNRAKDTEPVMAPCLSPVLDTELRPLPPEDRPEMTVCLSIAPEREPSGDKASAPSKAVRDDLLERGVLPDDVVEALRRKHTEES